MTGSEIAMNNDTPKTTWDGQVRRIVTGHDAQGRSVVTEDRAAPSVHTNPKRVGYVLTQLWATDQTPAFVGNEPDPTARPLKLEPPKNGSVVRIIEFGPEGEWIEKLSTADTQVAWGALGTATASTNQTGRAKHPFMHRTQSVDYALVLDGEITLVLDEEDVLMKAGDFLVERGTNHAWANRSGRPCRILFVLIDGQFDPAIASHFTPGH
jgi:mannose-6-phosphate isomerase-like protein (cupin superfamily)